MQDTEVSHNVVVNASAASVQSTMRHLHDELAQLLEKRTAVMRRIAGAKRTIVGLAALFGDTALDDDVRKLVGMRTAQRLPGLTDMCRTVLMEADRGLTVHDIQTGICGQNPALLAGHKNPVASLTTILNRLVTSGEAQRFLLNNNRRVWQWVVDTDRPSAGSTDAPDPESPVRPSDEDELEQAGSMTGRSG
jgi:hypothetical protein